MPGANPSGGGMSWGTLANRPAPNIGVSLYVATDNGQAYWSDGAVWHLLGANDVPSVMASGNYYFTASQAPGSAITVSGGVLKVLPFQVPHDLTLSRIGIEVVAIGDVGSTILLGIYNDNGSGYPGSLALSAGTVAGDSATVQEIIINKALAAGLYWTAVVTQGAPVTSPQARGASGTGVIIPIGTPTIPPASASLIGYQVAGQPGALPDPYPAGGLINITPVRTFIKVA